jgi:hypothetical protein
MSFTRQIASPRLVTNTITSVSSQKMRQGASARFGQEPFGQGVTLEGLLDSGASGDPADRRTTRRMRGATSLSGSCGRHLA